MFDKHLADFAELLNRNRRASTLIGLLVACPVMTSRRRNLQPPTVR